MSDSIPSIPTPPMPKKSRSIVYGLWSWASVLLSTVTIGWAVIEVPPIQLLALATALNAFGAYAGFMAKNNVR